MDAGKTRNMDLHGIDVLFNVCIFFLFLLPQKSTLIQQTRETHAAASKKGGERNKETKPGALLVFVCFFDKSTAVLSLVSPNPHQVNTKKTHKKTHKSKKRRRKGDRYSDQHTKKAFFKTKKDLSAKKSIVASACTLQCLNATYQLFVFVVWRKKATHARRIRSTIIFGFACR